MSRSDESILIVDGNPHDVLLLKHALQESDLTGPVYTVQSGEEAINYLLGSGQFAHCPPYPRPTVLVQELDLPGMSGLELLRWVRLKSHLFNLFVVVLTASIRPGVLAEARKTGANLLFAKPGDWLQLRYVAACLKPYLSSQSQKQLGRSESNYCPKI